MTTDTFGPFLKELRTARGMTQPQLAEKLLVSTAAVSKWERSKCLPDIAKLEDLADVLDVSVLELMKCELRTPELPRQELTAVYTETLTAANRENGRKNAKYLLIAAAAAALVLLLHYFPLYRMALVWYPSYFETGEISHLACIGSVEDRAVAGRIMAQAEMAFSDLGLTAEEAREKYGLLSRYSFHGRPDAAAERHSLELWSAHFSGGQGQMWVCYSHEALDTSGQVIAGSRRIPSLWLLEKNGDGEWFVARIKEHP